ncbi:Polyketide synthase CurC [Cytospora mali]|uniref:Polyketide synthase CurC n=1 Tax=Cytospora mali TaxID=578113 RepID=A0A194WC17_CYTMA|nr:Polyketide synthase CurC [Valsa mali]
MSMSARVPLDISNSEGQLLITAFEGAIIVRVLVPPEDRSFSFEVTFQLDHPRLVALADQKPPLHFHPYQEEYMKVLEGRLCVDVDGQTRVLTKEDGELCVLPWAHHRLYPPPRNSVEDDSAGQRTVFLLSGSEAHQLFKLDLVFFMNWYAYQDDVVVRGHPANLFQVLSMFDAGGSYLSFPPWIPFGRYLSVAMGVFLGRWLGSLLGYQPFYHEWTTDWDAACHKMESSFFQRRFANKRKQK